MANKNNSLGAAKAAKNDEFYTQYEDIEREMNAYLEYDENVFRGKTVLLPCDDPEWSNFTKYFAQNFERFGLKKLISTSYAPESKKIKAWEPTLFETEAPQYDEDKSKTHGKIFILDSDTNGSGRIDVNDLRWEYLEGDGDFRSEEVTKLRDEADIVITNPPFSLFREFLAWIMEKKKKFIIFGNQGASAYSEVFPLIQKNLIWKGVHYGDFKFTVPANYEIRETRSWIDENGINWRSLGNACWFTNIEHGRRHQPLQLMTMADNIKYSKHKEIKGRQYIRYVNYDAIEVPFYDSIPSDYDGAMAVPITFLDKYCPEQFVIIGHPHGDEGVALGLRPFDRKLKSLNKGLRDGDLYYFDENGIPVIPYSRILIRHKK